MAALKSMAYTKAEQKERNSPSKDCAVGMYSGDKYPYGLRLDLNSQALAKLDLENLPKVGTKMTLTAEVEVVATRSSDRANGEPEQSMELQIVKLGLQKGSGAVAAAFAGIADADEA